ncbi:hypothetical protein GCM10009111_23570 [Colwellia asteriadis]|uniref:Uncharacterized protein n=1 Tax=Colwellia asteriadis TaxID=517723 RepID=A0ABP3WIM2_9GAMM
MKIFVIDKCGWVNVYKSEISVEESLEPIDIKNNEYQIINSNGFMYKLKPSLDTYSEFKLLCTEKRNMQLLVKLNSNQSLEQFKI